MLPTVNCGVIGVYQARIGLEIPVVACRHAPDGRAKSLQERLPRDEERHQAQVGRHRLSLEGFLREVDQFGVVGVFPVERAGDRHVHVWDVRGDGRHRGEPVSHPGPELPHRLERNKRLQLQRLTASDCRADAGLSAFNQGYALFKVVDVREECPIIAVSDGLLAAGASEIEGGSSGRVDGVPQHPRDVPVHERHDDVVDLAVLLVIGRAPAGADGDVELFLRAPFERVLEGQFAESLEVDNRARKDGRRQHHADHDVREQPPMSKRALGDKLPRRDYPVGDRVQPLVYGLLVRHRLIGL